MDDRTPSQPTLPTAWASAPSGLRYLTDQEREDSLRNALSGWQGDTDLWVYAYGSLIWNPGFDFREKRLGKLRGHHRALCLWSRINRGTPELPGLVFGLDRGGSCRGMAFQIAAQQVESTFDALWRREMGTGAYHPRWLRCETLAGPIKALAFVIDRTNPGYVKAMPDHQAVEIIRRANGRYGPCSDYVVQTHDALSAAGIHDRRLSRLAERLRQPLESR